LGLYPPRLAFYSKVLQTSRVHVETAPFGGAPSRLGAADASVSDQRPSRWLVCYFAPVLDVLRPWEWRQEWP